MELPAPSAPRTPGFELARAFPRLARLIALIGWLSPMILAPGKFHGDASTFVERFARWDASWFMAIADQGYSYSPGNETTVAFFSVLSAAASPHGWLRAAWSPRFPGFQSRALWRRRAALETDRGRCCGRRSRVRPGRRQPRGAAAALWPREHLFQPHLLRGHVPVFCCSRVSTRARQQWLVAGLAGLGAALTRNAGLLLAAPLLIEYYDLRLRAPHFPAQPAGAAGRAVPLPLAGIVLWGLFLRGASATRCCF